MFINITYGLNKKIHPGLILCKNSLAKKLNSRIFPGIQGGPLEHVIAAKAVAFGEALKPEFKVYSEQVVKNAKVLAQDLMAKGIAYFLANKPYYRACKANVLMRVAQFKKDRILKKYIDVISEID